MSDRLRGGCLASRLALLSLVVLVGLNVPASATGRGLGAEPGIAPGTTGPAANVSGLIDSVVGRTALSASSPDKVTHDLRAFVEHVRTAGGYDRLGAAEQALLSHQFAVNPSGSVRVYAYLTDWQDAYRAALEGAGVTVEHITTKPFALVQGWIPPESLDALAALPFVRVVTEPSKPVSNMGSVDAESDQIMHAQNVRSALGFNGTGITVGVLNGGGISARASAQASGDLPPDSRIADYKDANGDNEGTAMMEIIYDMAPGVNFGFYAPDSGADMANGIRGLSNAGCQVLVDDVTVPDEPCFEAGQVESAIDDVTKANRVYVTSAGNFARSHWMGTYSPTTGKVGGQTMELEKFTSKDGTINTNFLPITVAPGTYQIVLQWDDLWGSVGSDYDLYVTSDSAGANVITLGGVTRQSASGNAIEKAVIVNPNQSTNVVVYVAVRRYSGAIHNLQIYAPNCRVDDRFAVATNSIGFNNKAQNALVVGAINVNRDSNGNLIKDASGNPTEGAGYGASSQGPVYLDKPVPPPGTTFLPMKKPDVTGIDGVSVTGAGGFNTPFYGTSASAPTVAAVAALLWQARPNYGQAEVKAAIENSALDRGDAGYDYVYGYGLVDALATLQSNRILYVDPGAPSTPHNGQDWTHAYLTLQDALAVATSNNQVWCKYGQYNLTPPFVLPAGVQLYGGFSGAEGSPDQRQPVGAYGYSILDAQGKPGSVVMIPASAIQTTVLDGFKITGGTGTDPGFGQPYGGGVYVQAGGSPNITNNEITGNTAAYGGGLWVANSYSEIDRNYIHDNTATIEAGGVYMGGKYPNLRRSTVSNNHAPIAAGVESNGGGSLQDCLVTGNVATVSAGGVNIWNNSSAILLNCTVANNTAPAGHGGGVYIRDTSAPSIDNTIIASNSDGIVAEHAFEANHSDLWGNGASNVSGQPDPTGANGNISQDPQFLGPLFTRPYQLDPLSPCIDTGNDSLVGYQLSDILGASRLQGAHVDMGAYEALPPPVVYVKPGGNDANDGTSWGTAVATVQGAINSLPLFGGGEIWIAAGTYPNTHVTLRSYMRLYGGFAGTETDKRSRNIVANPTILDASGYAAPVVSIGDHAEDAVVDGLYLQGANQSGPGGGILVGPYATPVIQNNVIRNNTSSDSGGGLYASYSSAIIRNNTIVNNTTGNRGGAIAMAYCPNPSITNNRILHNHAGVHAGGIYDADFNGGRIADNIIALNWNDGGYGSGISVFNGSTTQIVNNTIVENQGSEAIRIHDGNSNPTIANNIIAFNIQGITTEGETFTFANNDVYNNAQGNYATLADQTGQNGNISADPLLARDAAGTLHIQAASPARDAGSNGFVLPGDTDIDGQARINGASVDIGADESYGESYVNTGITYVDASRSDDSGDGRSWATAKKTIQAAIDATAVYGGEVWVKQGAYSADPALGTVLMRAGVAIYGGFTGTETNRNLSRNVRSHATTLTAPAGAPVVTVPAGLGSSTVIEGFTITGGNVDSGGGGGIYVTAASPIIGFNVIAFNSTTNRGGGIAAVNCPNVVITNNIIDNNHAGVHGGGIYMENSNGRIAGNMVAMNRNDGSYGSGLSLFGSNAVVTNNTFTENLNDDAIRVHGGGSPVIANNIIAYNNQGVNGEGQTFTFQNNDVYQNPGGDFLSMTAPTYPDTANRNIGDNPLLGHDAAGVYHIGATSPARGKGSLAYVLAGDLDIDGQPRVTGGSVDIGADQSNGDLVAFPPVYYVSPSGNDANPGTSWAAARRTVQGGINAAAAAYGGEVWVAKGTYNETINLTTGVSVYGGFAGTEAARSFTRGIRANATVLTAAGLPQNPVINVPIGTPPTTVFEGFTVTGGNVNSGGGGGISITGASPVIRLNLITGNVTSNRGGGIAAYNCPNPTIADNEIIGNHAGVHGGGVYLENSNGRIASNVVAMNANDGDYGAGITLFGSSAAVVNNTVVENYNSDGIRIHGGGSPVIGNNIIAFNRTGINGEGQTFDFHNNDTYGNTLGDYVSMTAPPSPDPATHNISADPLLVRDRIGMVRIGAGSPAKDAGSNADVLNGDVDVDANVRIIGSVDIGASEMTSTPPVADPRVVYVDAARPNDNGDGATWATAKQTIQAGIAAAQSTGGEVWVKQGQYTGTVTLATGVSVYGGFSGVNGETRANRSFRANPTTITVSDAAPNATIVNVPAGVPSTTVFEGFNIAGANVTDGSGGGITMNGTSAVIRFNFLTNNATSNRGGGIAAYNCPNPTIANNAIQNNHAGVHGGGLYVDGSNGRIANNLITGNSNDGDYGSGITLFGSNAIVTNNTVADNHNSDGIRVHGGGSPVLVNNIVAFNTRGVNAEGQSFDFRNNDVYGNAEGDYISMGAPDPSQKDFTLDPRFVTPGSNYRLQAGSPCADAGSDADVFGTQDVDTAARIQGLHVDVGAYETIVSSPYALADVVRALQIAGGLSPKPTLAEIERLNIEGTASPSIVNVLDAIRIDRKAAGRDPNP